MKPRKENIDLKHSSKAVFCISVGTAVGLVVYGIFLFFKIAIFGWNLGLIFAPLSAGYVETVISRRILGKSSGAISAFILFIYTTFYSFILKNPTLGINLITAGSILVILQSAFPTLVNYLIMVILGAIASNIKWTIGNARKRINTAVKDNVKWETADEEVAPPYFDEAESNRKLNSQGFYFITSTDMHDRPYKNIGICQSQVIIENEDDISVKREIVEEKRLVGIKKGKDECLLKLINIIKENGGNGILDLEIEYGLIGMKGDNIHIIATGMAINIK